MDIHQALIAPIEVALIKLITLILIHVLVIINVYLMGVHVKIQLVHVLVILQVIYQLNKVMINKLSFVIHL